MAKTLQAAFICFFISALAIQLVRVHPIQWSLQCLLVVLLSGKTRLKEVRSCLQNPRKTQEERWKEITTENKETVYGAKVNLGNIRSLKELTEKLPLTTYSSYDPYVQRIAKGEKNVMSSDPITRLVLTSGTTGKGKLIPVNMNQLTPLFGLLKAHQQECFPSVQQIQPVFRLHCNSKLTKSECGITIGAAMALEHETAQRMLMFSTPPDGFMIDNIHEALYIHFLFALRERYLGSTMAIYTSMMVDGFKFLEDHWPAMVNDIANGTIDQKLKLPISIRESLEKAIESGDVERAEEVRRECEKGQEGIMKRLWPFMEYVTVIDNIQIRNKLMQTIGKGLTFFSPIYSASEGLVGLNMDPFNKGDEEYVMAVWDFIYEFITEEDIDNPCPGTLLIDEVQVGKNYEVVITHMNGLYRYRFGDVVQVTGYYKNTPKVKFLYRTATLLNLFGGKVDQPAVAEALKNALGHWPGIQMMYYSVAESTMLSGMPEYNDDETRGAHYVFFLEMKTTDGENFLPDMDTTQLAKLIDENIYIRHSFYRIFRDTNQIHGSKVYLVKPGTFNQVKNFILKNTSASVIQFKMPQKIRTKELAKLMLTNKVR